MELGQRMKQARLEAGLSQRQLCGDVITRNMLSQIEHGTAQPSMNTLQYLASQLGKPVSYFLEESVASPDQQALLQAREALEQKNFRQVPEILDSCREPGEEGRLLKLLALLELSRQALAEERLPYARKLLQEARPLWEEGLYTPMLRRRGMLLMAKAFPGQALPDIDEELQLRAELALEAGDFSRCAALLDSCQSQESPGWNFLRGEVSLRQEAWAAAAIFFHRAEEAMPRQTAPKLEQCYRELEDYKRAYEYACKQK